MVVLNFFKREKHADVVITHLRTFALVFACIVVFLSILRGITLINDGVAFEALPLVLFISAPVGLVEGYGIYLTIKKSLSRTITMKSIGYIHGVFFGVSVMELGFINLLALFAV